MSNVAKFAADVSQAGVIVSLDVRFPGPSPADVTAALVRLGKAGALARFGHLVPDDVKERVKEEGLSGLTDDEKLQLLRRAVRDTDLYANFTGRRTRDNVVAQLKTLLKNAHVQPHIVSFSASQHLCSHDDDSIVDCNGIEFVTWAP